MTHTITITIAERILMILTAVGGPWLLLMMTLDAIFQIVDKGGYDPREQTLDNSLKLTTGLLAVGQAGLVAHLLFVPEMFSTFLFLAVSVLWPFWMFVTFNFIQRSVTCIRPSIRFCRWYSLETSTQLQLPV